MLNINSVMNGSLSGVMYDIINIASIAVFYHGMTRPSFVYIRDDLNEFIKKGTPMKPNGLEQGQFTLIKRGKNTKDAKNMGFTTSG